jgi:hypothetical protein
MRGAFRVLFGGVAATLIVAAALSWPELDQSSAQQPTAKAVFAESYLKDIRPLLKQHCGKCHTGKDAEAEVDLDAFATFADVRKGTKTWLKISEMIDSGQMPPKDAKPLSDADKTTLQKWLRGHLKNEASAHAGDPGRVVLRRLSNSEYTYTLRDLTGIAALDPAKEFPVDGAAGEGFTNTGDALGMSPTLLTKYLQAAKRVAAHAVLLPSGIAWSPATTRNDWTNAKVAEIREFYRRHTKPGSEVVGGSKGIDFFGASFRDLNDGAVIPLEVYLAAIIDKRGDDETLSRVYRKRLENALQNGDASALVARVRDRLKTAKPGDAAALARDIRDWQRVLWKFNSVGHIGKVGGPKSWLEGVNPLTARYDAKLKMPAASNAGDSVTFYLSAGDAGDGSEHDVVVWQNPRFVAPGKPDLPLKDVREVARNMAATRHAVFANTEKYLRAAEDVVAGGSDEAAAKNHGVDIDALRAWLDVLGITGRGPAKIEGHFKNKLDNPTYKFINGWGNHETPLVLANSSDTDVRIPGKARARGVVVHPSPKLDVVVAWQSPIDGVVQLQVNVAHAHPECGNGVTWAIERRGGSRRERLANGIAQGGNPAKIDVIDKLDIKKGEAIVVAIGPRDANHSCDLTSLDMTITAGDAVWNLANDVSSDLASANPHPDRRGNQGVWHFLSEPSTAPLAGAFAIPKGSLLDRWRAASGEERVNLAQGMQNLMTFGPTPNQPAADSLLRKQLDSFNGPILSKLRMKKLAAPGKLVAKDAVNWGLDPAEFGKHPTGKGQVAADSLCVKAPNITEIRVPLDLVAGMEFVAGGAIHPDHGDIGCVQLQVGFTKPQSMTGVIAPTTSVSTTKAGDMPTVNFSTAAPFVAAEKSLARARFEKAFDDFRAIFPIAVCYTKIVPVDEVVTLTLFYREDDHLCRLMLTDAEKARLDKLWDELHYISRDALTMVDGLEQLIQYATQDGDPKLFEPLRKPFKERADAFRKQLADSEAKHLEGVIDFAKRAYRRPVTKNEREQLVGLYQQLRKQEIAHDEAIRLTLARVLVAPAFLYRLETPGPAAAAVAVNDYELATRLSYFLWSSGPDEELLKLAAAGKLRDPDVLREQAKRMVKDDRVRRLAIEFACQWLHIRGFDGMSEKSERHFPTFLGLREHMYEESIQFFSDFFRRDRSVLDLLDSNDTYLNQPLAEHYGIPGIVGNEWRRVENVKKYGRGGILGLATTLATQSGASRTSPILRGNWISEVLLGEKLPRPPKGVPQLPDDETKTEGLTVRQLVERHASDAKCAVCHKRIDAYGFALEGFDAIGRRRDKDLANRPIDTKAKAMDGAEFDGIDGLRQYLLTVRKDAFVRQFCKKLLGYALARGVQLSDEPLLDEMQSRLAANEYRVGAAIDAILRSRQFREIRGKDFAADE